MNYQLTSNPHIIRRINEDGSVTEIPEGHAYWNEYQDFLNDGNTPLPADEVQS